jgi:hypothetical protein
LKGMTVRIGTAMGPLGVQGFLRSNLVIDVL